LCESKAVSLVASKGNNVFGGPLSLPSGVSLLIDARVTLKAIANPSLFDAGKIAVVPWTIQAKVVSLLS
jgi:polygalacturonase